jgi:hypothetical protein
MSAVGTFRTLRDVRLKSVSGPKADIDTSLFPALNLPLVIKKQSAKLVPLRFHAAGDLPDGSNFFASVEPADDPTQKKHVPDGLDLV